MTTNQGDAETVLRSVCDAAFSGNALDFLNGITSEAYVDLLHILPALSKAGAPESYVVEEHNVAGEDECFHLHIQGPTLDVQALVTMRHLGGGWKLAAIKVEGIRE